MVMGMFSWRGIMPVLFMVMRLQALACQEVPAALRVIGRIEMTDAGIVAVAFLGVARGAGAAPEKVHLEIGRERRIILLPLSEKGEARLACGAAELVL